MTSSEGRLRSAQRAVLQSDEVAGVGERGVHAEINGVNAATEAGLTPISVAPSRAACPACTQALEELGIRLLTRDNMMAELDKERLEESLGKLAPWKRIVYMAQICMRMLPNCERFSAETGFGDVSVLKRALNAAWYWVESGEPPCDLSKLREDCERQAPDTERFRSPYTSAALDAANAAAATLDAIEVPDESQASEVASLARDTVDLFVQDLMNLDPSSPDLEEVVVGHELMQRELRWQREDLEALTNWTADRSTAAKRLRIEAESRPGILDPA